MNIVPQKYQRSQNQQGRSSQLIKSVGHSLVSRVNKVLASTDQIPNQNGAATQRGEGSQAKHTRNSQRSQSALGQQGNTLRR